MNNLIVLVVGIVAIIGCVFMLRYRVAVRRFIISQNRTMYGKRLGDRMERRTTPMTGVGVPAIGGMVIGSVFVLVGIFGHPH